MFDVLFFILVGVLFFILWSFGFSCVSIAPWVPAHKKDLSRINRLADLRPKQTFLELGCGDGRVCRYIAKNNPDAKVIGIEISIPMFLIAKIISFFSGSSNLEIKFGNVFNSDFKEIDVIYVFGVIKSMNSRLKEKFIKELKPNAKVISYAFSIENWEGKELVDKPEKKSLPINVYIKSLAKKE